MQSTIEITVNGKPMGIESGATVVALLQALELAADAVAVERNGRVVPRPRHGDEQLEAGDVLEVVRFVGGG